MAHAVGDVVCETVNTGNLGNVFSYVGRFTEARALGTLGTVFKASVVHPAGRYGCWDQVTEPPPASARSRS
jgi:hypothetical protein